MRSEGFSLLELIVIVAIMVALLAIGIPSLSKYLKKYRIDSEINTLYSNLMNQRFRSMNTGVPHGVIFNSSSQYTLFEFDDKNYNLQFDGSNEEKNPANIAVPYSFNSNVVGEVVLFDRDGIARNGNWGFESLTVYISVGDSCIAISSSRVKMGVWDGSNCKIK